MDDLRQELAALRAIVDRQQQRIADLESEKHPTIESDREDGVTTRRSLLAGAAAAVAGGAMLASARPAEAANGGPLLMGDYNNVETAPCALSYKGGASTSGMIYGLGVVDQTLDTFSVSAGVAGHTGGSFEAGTLGYDNSASPGKVGVMGDSKNGYGVFGRSGNVAIQARGRRRGLNALTFGNGIANIAVYAGVDRSQGGGRDATALLVDGVFRAKRAGVAIVPAGTRAKVVNITQLTNTSLVIATAQKLAGTIAVQAVTVKATVPTNFTIRLNANAPAGGMPVAWFVVDTIGAALS